MRALFIALVLSGLFPLLLSAQEGGTPVPKDGPAVEHWSRITGKTIFLLSWRTSDVYEFLPDILQMGGEEIRRDLGITEEQSQRVVDILASFGSDNYVPGLQEARDRMRELRKSVQDLPAVPEETEKELVALYEIITPRQFETLNAELAEVLTLEQRREYQEFLIAASSVLPFFCPQMFDALDLTDEQRTLLEETKKELEPVAERLHDLVYADMKAYQQKFESAIKDVVSEESFSKMTFEERGKIIKGIEERLIRENPEIKTTVERLRKQGREFRDRYKIQMFDILTDEQMTKFTRLVNNPPEYAKRFIAMQKKALDEAPKKEVWVPGPNSWQPGDPIPEGYLQQREERRGTFPRPKPP